MHLLWNTENACLLQPTTGVFGPENPITTPNTLTPQVKYVVELARALAQHPAVFRMDLLTRLSA